MSINLAAARFVHDHATDAADEQMLLQMLGLINDDGQITPDSHDYIGVPRDPSKVTGMGPLSSNEPSITPPQEWFLDRPKVSTAPEALRNLPPVAPKPVVKVVKPVKQRVRAQAPHGSEVAAKRHVRYKEPLCDKCQAGRESRRIPVTERTTHGTKAGYTWHYRHNEMPCVACSEANAQYRREHRAATQKTRPPKPVAVKAPRPVKVVKERVPAEPKPIVHGTRSGADAHWRRKESPCESCLTAYNASRPSRSKGRSKPRPACGSDGGYRAHTRRGEQACDLCIAAERARGVQRRERTRAA